MAMKHSTTGTTCEQTAAGSTEAGVRVSEEVPPSSVPFGASAGGALPGWAGGGEMPG